MRLPLTLLALLLQLISALEDKCPKGDYACIDIMNSSQCIEQLIIEKLAPATKEALIKCVEYEGVASTLPGASKVSEFPKRSVVVGEFVLIKQ
jgi:hypothetical protein